MAPRGSVFLLRVTCLIALLAVLIAPATLAWDSCERGPSAGGGGVQGIEVPPGGGGPGSGSGGDNGDPDDISILFNDPTDPTVISSDQHQRDLPSPRVRFAPYRGAGWYVFFWWTGIGW